MKKILILFCCCYAAVIFAQHAIAGQVANQRDGVPLKGVKITTTGNVLLATTDAEGKFAFSVTTANEEVVFRKQGFTPQRIPADAYLGMPMRILMSEAVVEVEEVTLSTGYQNIPKERSTGSFSTVKKSLLDQQVSTGILERIINVANAVSLDRGTGEEPQLMVRGISTINGPKSPLIVLDNFPYEGNLGNINPNTVESVTVLKDAAAASIWGARAANGVIVITTKKGKADQKINVSFSASTGIGDKPDLNRIKSISSADYIEVERELFAKGFYDSEINSPNHPVLSPVVDLLNQERNGLLSAEEADSRINYLKAIDSRQQFSQYMYRPSVKRQYFLDISGGSSKTSWLTSLGYDENTGNLDESYKRWNVRFQNSWKPHDRITVTSEVYFTDTGSGSGKTGYGSVDMHNGNAVPYMQLADQLGNPLPVARTYDQNAKNAFSQFPLLDWNYYPLTDWQYDKSKSSTKEIMLNAGLKYLIVKGLDAEVKYQYQYQNTEDEQKHGAKSYYARNYVNSFAQIEDNAVNFILPVGAIWDHSSSVTGVNNLRGQLNYGGKWDRHAVNAIAGGEVRESKVDYLGSRNYGVNETTLNSSAVDYVNPYPLLIPGYSDYIQRIESIGGRNLRFMSLFANAGYVFDQTYSITASFRRDASNLFGLKTNDRWNPFWSVGAGWELSRSPFFKVPFLPYLKLRASYGFNGNIDPAMVAVSTIAYDWDNSYYTGTPTARIDNYFNPKLRWETSGMLNVGLDFSGLNNRVSGSVDFFKKRGKDLFGPQMLDYTTGVGYMLANVAQTEGRGLDVNFNAVVLNSALRWDATVNFSTFKDEIKDYYLGEPSASQFIGNGTSVPISGIVGKPVYSIFAYRWAGLDPQTGDPRGYLDGEISKDYTSIVGAGTTVGDLEYFGSALPTYYGSFINSFSYKNFSLDFALSYKLGYWFRRQSINYTQLFNDWSGHSDYALRWKNPGDEQQTYVPSNTYEPDYNRDAFYGGSSVLVEKGDHVRLQYVTLNYHFDSRKYLGRTFSLPDFTLFFNVSNVGILWRANNKGIDPDYNLGGNTMLPPSIFTVGIRTKF